MKMFSQYLLIITLCTHKSLTFSDQEIEQLYQDYDLKKPNLEEKLRNIPKKVFQDINAFALMKRITNYERLLDFGSGGIMIKATYQPRWTDSFVASIKIILDDKKYSEFNRNLIQAYLTGSHMTDRYNPGRRDYVSLDYSEVRAEININELIPNLNATNINQFYEMQQVPVEYKETESSDGVPYYITIMVTEFGKRDLAGELFEDHTDIKTNTGYLIHYFLDIVRAGSNVNAQGVLHGDIKPENMILVPSVYDYNVNFIGFDLSFFVNKENCSSDILRYSGDFRAPWLKQKLCLVYNSETKKKEFQNLYTYSLNFVEDSYAIAKSIIAIYESNKKFINEKNGSLRKMIKYLKDNIIKKCMLGPTKCPTTSQIFEHLNWLLEIKTTNAQVQRIKWLDTRKRTAETTQEDFPSKARETSIVTPVSKMNQKPKDSPLLEHKPFLGNNALMVSVQSQLPKGGKERMIV
jgi:serine/threonine protein kinase